MNLFVELSRIQQEIKAPKGQLNKFGNYNYRSCEDILEAVKPLLGKCVVMLSDKIVQIGDRTYVKATATLRLNEDTTSVSAFAREPEHKKGMDESQITGAASSYARKYALNGLFCIDDNKDADTHAPPTSYTDDQKSIYDDLLIKAEPMPFYKFCESVEQTVLNDLYNSAEQGKKTEHKKKHTDTLNAASQILDVYKVQISELHESEDVSAIELWNELDEFEKTRVWARLNDDIKSWIKELKKDESN